LGPLATEGASAVRSVWRLRDGMRLPPARSCPEGSHTLPPTLKRLAKMLVGDPNASFGSYHVTHGTVRPVPAKSIEGASASFVGSMLSDAGNPCVTQAPFLNARTKICCALPTFCSNVAHGTSSLPAVTAPAVTSETPASWLGAIELAGSSFTCEPADGRGARAACAGARRARAPAMSAVAARVHGAGFMRFDLLPIWCTSPVQQRRPGSGDVVAGVREVGSFTGSTPEAVRRMRQAS